MMSELDQCPNCGFKTRMSPKGERAYQREIAQLQQRNALLEEGIKKIIEEGYPPIPKAEQCVHGQYGYQDCIGCVDDALEALLPTLPALPEG